LTEKGIGGEKTNLLTRLIGQKSSAENVITALRLVVFLNDKRAIYFGRNGEYYIEEFPAAK
jgi:hypothetical protein